METLNLIAEIGRFLGNGPFVNTLFAFGYLIISRDKFAKIFICTMLMGLLFNIALKVTFKVPLHNIYGYAIPSGHTQYSIILWTCLIIEYRAWLVSLLSLVSIFLVGFYLIYFGYHNIYDVLYGILSAIPGLVIYYYFFRNQKNFKLLTFYSLLAGAALVSYTYALKGLYYPKYSLFFYVLLVTFSVGWLINKKLFEVYNIHLKLKFLVYKVIFSFPLLLSSHFTLKHFFKGYDLMSLYNLSISNLICNMVIFILATVVVDVIYNTTLEYFCNKSHLEIPFR